MHTYTLDVPINMHTYTLDVPINMHTYTLDVPINLHTYTLDVVSYTELFVHVLPSLHIQLSHFTFRFTKLHSQLCQNNSFITFLYKSIYKHYKYLIEYCRFLSTVPLSLV